MCLFIFQKSSLIIKKIKVKKIIPASKIESLNKIEIKTNFIGEYDQKILVKAAIDDFSSHVKNDFSLISLAGFKK